MSSWQTAPLRSIAEIRVSTIDKKTVEGELPVRLCNYTDVYYQNQITAGLDLMVATATPEQARKFGLRGGDTIMTKDSETPGDIGMTAYVPLDLPGVVCGYHLAVIRPGARVHARYLSWALQSEFVHEQLSASANGVTRFGLTYSAIQGAAIPMPPPEDQPRIATFLDDQVTRIERAIELRQRQRDQLVERTEALALEAVTGRADATDHGSSGSEWPLTWVPRMPYAWGVPRICQVARMGTGHTPSRSEPAYWVDCTIPWLTTADVHKFRADEIDTIAETEFSISEVGLAHSAAVKHPPGTVALSRTASAGFAIVMGTEMATSQDFATWTPGPDLDSHFLLWCLRAMRRDIMGRLATGSTHKTIYFPDLMSIRIPLPPLGEQRRIVAEAQRMHEQGRAAQEALTKSIALLQERKRSVITAAVTGELDLTSASREGGGGL